MLTLVVTFLLMVLLGAFIIVHRGNSSLTISGQKRQKAFNVCTSGLHYLWGELELDPAFGAAGLPSGPARQFPAGDPKIEIRYFGEPPEPGEIPDIESNYIEGKILGTSDTFVVRFINNLENRSAAEETQLGTVPARCAKVEVLGTSSGVSLKLESVLRKKPYVDYSMLSSQELSLELDVKSDDDKWVIGSDDPYINQIRSNDEILGPSALDEQLLFEGPPRGGVAKATEDVVLDGTSVQSDPDFMNQSQKKAEGTFQVGTSNVDVPGLDRDDLRLPNNAVDLPGGTLSMRKVEKHEWESRDFPIDTDGDGTPDTTETRYRLGKTNHNAVQYENNLWVASSGRESDDAEPWLPFEGDEGFFPVEGGDDLPSNISSGDDYPVLYASDDAEVQADLTTGDIAFSPGSKFEFAGDFKVTKEEGALTPSILMGYEVSPGQEPIFSAGEVPHSVAAEAPEQYSTALVTGGSLTIEGPVSGYGTLFADDAVSLRAKPTLSADPVMAVALHGESVNFTVQEPSSSDKSQRSFLESDWEAFQKSTDKNPDDDSAGYESYENWHKMDSPADLDGKNTVIGDDPDIQAGIRFNKVGLTGDEAAEALADEFDLAPGDIPNFSVSPFDSGWSGGSSELTLEQYVGLREYLRKPDATGRDTWITLSGPPGSSGFDQITRKIRTQVDFYARWSEYMNRDMNEFMSQDDLRIADVFFVGLVHAGTGGFHAEAADYSLYFEGALVSQGNIDISDTPWAKFVYNRDYLDDVIKHNFADPIHLDQVYFKLN
jgi:hypothetical protein